MSDLVKRLRRLEGGLSHTTMSGEIEVIDATIGEIERLEKLAFRHMAEDANRKQRIEELEKERDELRAIFPEICRAIGNGAGCTEQASVEFLREIPKEIAAVIGDLKARLAKYEGELT